jgi:hypothetical protein
MVLLVLRRIHWGIGRFWRWALPIFCLVRKLLWLCWNWMLAWLFHFRGQYIDNIERWTSGIICRATGATGRLTGILEVGAGELDWRG